MFESKIFAKVAVLFIFIGAAVGSSTLFRLVKQSEAFLTTSSPKGTYTVQLTGQKDRPTIPFVSHRVVFSVSRNDEVILKNKYLHSGDWLDPSFELLYPEDTWVNDNILHFYQKQLFSEAKHDTIVIVNKMPEAIQYLRLTSVDAFLLFDVQAQSTTALAVSIPRGDSRWISVEGRLLGGTSIQGRGVGFLFPKDKQGPFSYYVYIDGNSFTIESPDLEKYKEN